MTIKHNISGDITVNCSGKTVNILSTYTPKGCPFNGYTLLDLVKDFINMYSWKICRGQSISLNDFIKLLQHNGIAHAIVYGDDIISLMEL